MVLFVQNKPPQLPLQNFEILDSYQFWSKKFWKLMIGHEIEDNENICLESKIFSFEY